jgi:pimeloyl-ACP methyl ester carboxylesterase
VGQRRRRLVARALVVVYGAAEDDRVWQPLLAALADEFTVVAWHEPGAGRSSDVPTDFGLPSRDRRDPDPHRYLHRLRT